MKFREKTFVDSWSLDIILFINDNDNDKNWWSNQTKTARIIASARII